MSELEEIVGELNKRFGKKTIISGDEITALELPRASTGSLALDIETGGGFPFGRMVEIYGRESAGKSFVATKTVAEVQKLNKKAVWIDVEGTFDREWATILGVDVSKLLLARPESGEDACDILDAVIRSGDCGIVVLDSTAALVPEKDLETDMGSVEQIGTRAKMMNRLIRKLHSALNMKIGEDKVPNDCLVIFINQIREKVGVMYGSPDTTPGGLGLRHAASVRVHFRKKWIKDPNDSEKILGQTVTFVTEKNKTYPPYRRGQFDIYTDGEKKGQIGAAREVLAYGILSGLVEHSGKSYIIEGEKLVGKDNAAEYLEQNPKIVDSLRKKIISHFFEGVKPK